MTRRSTECDECGYDQTAGTGGQHLFGCSKNRRVGEALVIITAAASLRYGAHAYPTEMYVGEHGRVIVASIADGTKTRYLATRFSLDNPRATGTVVTKTYYTMERKAAPFVLTLSLRTT